MTLSNMIKGKRVDFINIFLFVVLLFLVGRLFIVAPFGVEVQTTPLEPQPSLSGWGRNRDFPPDFTEEEKIILTEQYHDYERTSIEMDKAYEHFLELLTTYRSRIPELTIIKYKEDCFVRPVILAIKSGQAVILKNINDTSVGLGVGGEQWNVPAFESITVYPKLREEVLNQVYWGYSCSDKGLAGYFVKEQ